MQDGYRASVWSHVAFESLPPQSAEIENFCEHSPQVGIKEGESPQNGQVRPSWLVKLPALAIDVFTHLFPPLPWFDAVEQHFAQHERPAGA